MHLAAQLMRSSWAPTISPGSHQNIGLHTDARANVVLLTYLQWPSGRVDFLEPGEPGFKFSSRQPQVVVAHQHWAHWINV